MGTTNSGAPIGQGVIDRLGLRYPCVAAITTNLTATYANGTSGVGATLTNAGAQAAFPTQDGVASALNNRYLVTGQSSTFQNGVYILSTLGTGATNWVLTRSTYSDEPSELIAGAFVYVSNPARPRAYVLTATVTTVGTTAVTYAKLGNVTTTATDGISIDMGTGGQLVLDTIAGVPYMALYNDQGDAQPTTAVGSTGYFAGGAGGATAVDVSLQRSAAGIWTISTSKMQSSAAPTVGNDFVNKTYADSGSQTMTNKTLTSPAITTPTGIVKGDVGLGNVDNTSNATERAATATLANKRITPRVTSITSSATPTINTDDCDAVDITALATAITSMTSNLSGTPANKDRLVFEIKDNGTARAITWGASFVAGGVALPTTTVLSKILTVGFMYSTANGLNKWRCIASAQET